VGRGHRTVQVQFLEESAFFQELHDKQIISSELEEKMRKTLTTFGETFKATKGLN